MIEILRVAVVVVLAITSMMWVQLSAGTKRQRGFRIALATWAWLVLSEVLLLRTRQVDQIVAGDYSISALAEAVVWLVCAFFLIAFILRSPSSLDALRKGPLCWTAWYVAAAAVSVVWAPSPWYSAVWVTKLVIILLTLTVLATTAGDIGDVTRIMHVAAGTFLIAALAPFAFALVDPSSSSFWIDEQSGGSGSISTSEGAAVALLLAIAVADQAGRKVLLLVALASCVAMFAGIGKTAIIAAMISASLYLVLTRGPRGLLTSMAYVGVVAVVGGIVVASDPGLGEHLRRYLEQDNAATISGRIPLWREAYPYIAEQWIVGHGYLSSRFFFLNTLSDHLTFLWTVSPPTSLHSAYLDIAYNHGMLGLVLMLCINASAVLTFARVWRSRRSFSTPHRVAFAAAAALYVGAILNGIAGVYFGGYPHKGFVIFLTSLTMGQMLLSKLAKQPVLAARFGT
jgi:hypothetical protein